MVNIESIKKIPDIKRKRNLKLCKKVILTLLIKIILKGMNLKANNLYSVVINLLLLKARHNLVLFDVLRNAHYYWWYTLIVCA
jgi:hypothetical protein